MKDNLPSNIRDPMCFSYLGEIKMAYTEFNDYNANESFRVRRVRHEKTPDGVSLIFFVVIDKEKYNINELVKSWLPDQFYGRVMSL